MNWENLNLLLQCDIETFYGDDGIAEIEDYIEEDSRNQSGNSGCAEMADCVIFYWILLKENDNPKMSEKLKLILNDKRISNCCISLKTSDENKEI